VTLGTGTPVICESAGKKPVTFSSILWTRKRKKVSQNRVFMLLNEIAFGKMSHRINPPKNPEVKISIVIPPKAIYPSVRMSRVNKNAIEMVVAFCVIAV
jgi:hypothetical protein